MLRKSALALAIPTAFAVPAHATSTMTCTAAGNPRLRLDLSVGSLVGPVIASAALTDGGRSLVTGQGQAILAQAWIDATELRAEIVDGNGEAAIALLIARRTGRTADYRGTLTLRGRPHAIRCRYEEEA